MIVGYAWDKLFRHAFIKENGIKFQETQRYNDALFTYSAYFLAEKITILNQKLAHYRKRGGGSISDVDEVGELQSAFETISGLKSFMDNHNLSDRFGLDFSDFAIHLLIVDLKKIKRVDKNIAQKYQSLIRNKYISEFGIDEMKESDFYKRSDYEEYLRIKFSPEPAPEHIEYSDNPKLSVIVPCLNSAKYIDECIQSIQSSTLKRIEILCVDAGSTDGTLEKLSSYAEQDPRIRIISSPKKSYGYQVNLGLDIARGEYFAIVESDDYILSEMYETLYNLAQKHQLDTVKSNYCRFYGDKDNRTFDMKVLTKDSEKYNKILDPSQDLALLYTDILNTPGIYSLKFIRKYDIRLNETSGASFQDCGLYFQIFMHSKRMYFIQNHFYMLRRDNTDSSVMSKSKVYCSSREYDFIREKLRKDPKLEEKYAPICAYRRYYSYCFHLRRIAPEYIFGFLIKFSEDFREIEFNGELNKELFTPSQWENLRKIMDDPDGYYAVLNKQNSPNNALLTKINRYYTKLMQCYKENGLIYTFKKVLEFLHIKKT